MEFKLLLFVLLASAAGAEVRMGFEVELPGLKLHKSALQSDPVIKEKTWRLFTDMQSTYGYTLEFATSYGYDETTVITAARQIEETAREIVQRINTRAASLPNIDAFKELLAVKAEKLRKIRKCVYANGRHMCKANLTVKALKNRLTCFLLVLNKDKIVDNHRTVLKQLNNKVKLKTGSRLNKLNKKLARLNQEAAFMSKGELSALKRQYAREKLEVNRTGHREVYCEYIMDKRDKINKKNLWLDDYTKDQFIESIRGAAGADRKLIQVARLLTRYSRRVSEIFYKTDKSIAVNNKFQPYCLYEVIRKGDSIALDVCKPETLEASFQLTYQFPISAFTRIFEHYASYSRYLNVDNSKEVLGQLGIPRSLVMLGDNLMNEKLSTGNYAINLRFDQLWTTKVKAAMRVYINQLYAGREDERQAEGLFYLFLSYARSLFNRANTDEKMATQEEELPYGPKRNLQIMSRLSFSEMYENLRPEEQSKFVKMLSALCGPEHFGLSNSTPIRLGAKVDRALCKEMKLVMYGLMGSFNCDPEAQYNEPLTLLEWAQSIVDDSYRHPNQPKMKSVDPNLYSGEEDELLMILNSDKLSPPLCYTRSYIKDYYEHDEELLDTYGAKAIYSMGAYTGVAAGQTIAEFRSYSSLHSTVSNIKKFVSEYGVGLLHVIEGRTDNQESGASDNDHAMTDEMAEDVSMTDANIETSKLKSDLII